MTFAAIALMLMQFGPPSPIRTDAVLNDMAAAQKACGADGITYVQFSNNPRKVYVLVPRAIHARRKEAAVADAIACSEKIAIDHGLKPVTLGTER